MRCGIAAALWLMAVVTALARGGGALHPEAGQGGAAGEPFRLVGGYLVVVQGSIGGLPALNFVIDTGTSRTVIHQDIAGTLGLAPTGEEMLVFGERAAAETVVVPSLAVGPLRMAGLPVLVADLQPLEGRFGVRLDAVVGMDVLRGGCFTIDYAAWTMVFGCGRDLRVRAPLDARSPYPIVDASIDGARYRLMVDSGAEAIVLFEHAIQPGHRVTVDAEVEAMHVAGTLRLKRFTPRTFVVGRHTLDAPPVFILEGGRDTPGFDGVIGTRWLRSAQVRLDFARRVLSWR